MFIGAQHANAKGQPLHYASPRLRKDGRRATDELATQYLELIKQVSEARKVDLLEVSKKLKQSQQDTTRMQDLKNEAELKLKTAVDELGDLKVKSQRDAELILNYKKRLGL